MMDFRISPPAYAPPSFSFPSAGRPTTVPGAATLHTKPNHMPTGDMLSIASPKRDLGSRIISGLAAMPKNFFTRIFNSAVAGSKFGFHITTVLPSSLIGVIGGAGSKGGKVRQRAKTADRVISHVLGTPGAIIGAVGGLGIGAIRATLGLLEDISFALVGHGQQKQFNTNIVPTPAGVQLIDHLEK